MSMWTFELIAPRALTPEEEGRLVRSSELADGAVGYSTTEGQCTHFLCDLEAQSLGEAVAEARRRIHTVVPDLDITLETGQSCG